MYEKINGTAIKDGLIDEIVENKGYPKDVVEKVIAFQGEEILKAVRVHTQIDIAGFGLMYISNGKLNKRIKRLEDRIASGKTLYGDYDANLKFLKEKKCQNSKNT